MAAYFHPEIHASGDHGGLHTLILMNPNLAAAAPTYPNSHHAPPPSPPSSHNILLLNSAAAAAAASAATLSHPPPPLHHPHNPQFLRLPPHQEGITLYGYPPQQAREDTRRLHLSLSSEKPPPYGFEGLISPEPNREGEVSCVGQSPVLGSKYLKAAQELLEEVVHVGDGGSGPKSSNGSPKKPTDSVKGAGDSSDEGDKLNGGGAQLSTAERQDVQMKKAKLVSMLDEAEQRYRQYHQQMQIVIASFEQAAGYGSAKAYTWLALKTISKQFRCLKDAIQAQIKAANKRLGEDEGGAGVKIEGSRLKYIDHQIRQQKALQQLGMIQNHNAWRPQRGLPERSVSVLRAWLFEHFLHPYPKDSDKIMLAKQTGLTRSQVSNWFINARVRLWKPMIEEMYTEEMKDQKHKTLEDKNITDNHEEDEDEEQEQEQEQNRCNNNPIHTKNQTNPNNKKKDLNPSPSSPSFINPNYQSFNLASALPMTDISDQPAPKRQRHDDMMMMINFGTEQKHNNNSNNNNNNGYPVISGDWYGAEEFQTSSRSGISLSLGLPPFENNNHHHNHQHMEFPGISPVGAQNIHQTSAAGFECMDMQNRKGFAAQLLPDFVA